MPNIPGVDIPNAAQMSEVERLEAVFMTITQTAVRHIEKDLEVARAMHDNDAQKRYQLQISMYQHTQSIFTMAQQFATDKRWSEQDV